MYCPNKYSLQDSLIRPSNYNWSQDVCLFGFGDDMPLRPDKLAAVSRANRYSQTPKQYFNCDSDLFRRWSDFITSRELSNLTFNFEFHICGEESEDILYGQKNRTESTISIRLKRLSESNCFICDRKHERENAKLTLSLKMSSNSQYMFQYNTYYTCFRDTSKSQKIGSYRCNTAEIRPQFTKINALQGKFFWLSDSVREQFS